MLAGGSGTRLRPITYTRAKQLVPLANKPILFFGLEAIAAAGIREVGIVVGDTEEAFRAAVGDGSQFGLEVTYLRQDAPRGLAHAVLIAREFLADEPFLMYLGDNLVVGGVTGFVQEFQRSEPDALVLLAHVDRPEQFGVAELDADGRLVRLVEKPKVPPSDLALVGCYLFGPAVHDAVRAIEPSDRGELEITDAIQWLVANGSLVESQILATPFIDTGKLQDLLEANTIVLGALEGRVDGSVDDASELVGHVIIEAGARVVASKIVGPVAIGSKTVVERSVVGPSVSIGPDCLVADSRVEHSVLLEGAQVQGVARIVDSLLGRGARVTRSDGPYRLLLSDDSEIEVPSGP